MSKTEGKREEKKREWREGVWEEGKEGQKAFQMFSVVHFIKLCTGKVEYSLGIWEWSDVRVCCGGEFVNEIRWREQRAGGGKHRGIKCCWAEWAVDPRDFSWERQGKGNLLPPRNAVPFTMKLVLVWAVNVNYTETEKSGCGETMWFLYDKFDKTL